MKVLEAEKARAALAFERKCQTVKTKQNKTKQNVEKKKNEKKRGKNSESEKKGIIFYLHKF